MKLAKNKQVHYDSGPNMTPLVDVVMVILIFLMLAGSFAGTEHYLLTKTPFTAQGAGAEPPPGTIPDVPIEITVDAPSPDRFTATISGQPGVTTAAELGARLVKLRDLNAVAGKTVESTAVIIKPAKNVKFKSLMQVYEAASLANFAKISFAQSR